MSQCYRAFKPENHKRLCQVTHFSTSQVLGKGNTYPVLSGCFINCGKGTCLAFMSYLSNQDVGYQGRSWEHKL